MRGENDEKINCYYSSFIWIFFNVFYFKNYIVFFISIFNIIYIFYSNDIIENYTSSDESSESICVWS